ncbi:helix-turn-helix domain-containing protein, partial [Aerococcus mictus]|uniref:helix-turn-helix domain-containing protein n=1 Tax=Aerococcus mictus TaxID=2976810 RepID=UPI000DCC2F6D
MTIRQATPSDVASISKKDAAQLLDISVTLLEKLIATGDLPASKIGRAVRIR